MEDRVIRELIKLINGIRAGSIVVAEYGDNATETREAMLQRNIFIRCEVVRDLPDEPIVPLTLDPKLEQDLKDLLNKIDQS